MKRLFVLLIVLCPALALAQAPPPPPPPGGGGPMGGAPPPGAPGAVAGPGTTWLGGSLELNVAGGATFPDGAGGTASVDLDSAFALNGLIEYQMSDVLSVGLMPRYVFGIKGSGSTSSDSDSMLDLRARASAGTMVAPQMRAYGFGCLGYSIIYPPASAMSNETANGLTLTFGAGAQYYVNPRTRLFFEGGYELGFQSVSANGQSADFKINYLELGAGVQVAIGGQ